MASDSGVVAGTYVLGPWAANAGSRNAQGTQMGRQSFSHSWLEYGEWEDIPARIEAGGAVRPVISGTLSDFD